MESLDNIEPDAGQCEHLLLVRNTNSVILNQYAAVSVRGRQSLVDNVNQTLSSRHKLIGILRICDQLIQLCTFQETLFLGRF